MENHTTVNAVQQERHLHKVAYSPVNFSQIRRPTKPTARAQVAEPIATDDMTPPMTPTYEREPQQLEHDDAVFHSYLRALYHFDPSAGGPGANIQAAATIEPGDLVLVHSVHANGWADGTVLTTGVRGWLPTNYCEPFSHPYMANLLNAATQFWDLLGASEDTNLLALRRQDHIRALIAGVRYLLDHADCLRRHASLVQRHAGIRRMRKGLLADLSSLVQIAKRLREGLDEVHDPDIMFVVLEELMTKAFRVVTRAVGFLDMWTGELAEGGDIHAEFGDNHPSSVHVDPLEIAKIRTSHDVSARDSCQSTDENLAITLGRASSEASTGTSSPIVSHARHSSQFSAKRMLARFRPPSGLVSDRLSIEAADLAVVSTLASRQLAKAHDACISRIGSFIGLQMHSRNSAEMIAKTDGLIIACEALLNVVDQVALHDMSSAQAVKQARINFQFQVDELVRSTKDAFKISESPDDEVLLLPDQSSHLSSVGACLIRAVGECVSRTRALIQQIGDFNLDKPAAAELKSAAEIVGDSQSEDVAELDSFPAPPVHVEKEATHLRPMPLNLAAHKRSTSQKHLPPIPPSQPSPLRPRAATHVDATDFAMISPATTTHTVSPTISQTSDLRKSLPPPPATETEVLVPIIEAGDEVVEESIPNDPEQLQITNSLSIRKTSIGTAGSVWSERPQDRARDSGITAVSDASTRATTPDHFPKLNAAASTLTSSFDSMVSLRSAVTVDTSDTEAQLLQKTYVNELTFNKDGQVTGGSLPALLEQLSAHDAAPDSQFLSAFFMTFRAFTTPCELVQAMVDRFDYIGDSKSVGMAVRLRIFNLFKGWLESYWNADTDRDALGDIRFFAIHKLKPAMNGTGDRLIELTRKITTGYENGTINAPLVSRVGKAGTSFVTQPGNEANAPEPIVGKSQLTALRNSVANDTVLNILEIEPLEVARQLTIAASELYCQFQPEELLTLAWMKKDDPSGEAVRSICALATDLNHLVTDTILVPEDTKKRALIIKHWSKVGIACLELNNYESLMAITSALVATAVRRLRRTWELVSKKTKARLDELNEVMEHTRNYATLRRRLEDAPVPCLPFLGIFLSDLTFINGGNPKQRELPGVLDESGAPATVINFDKHMRMARVVSQLQRFQVPYALRPVPEMQAWLQAYLRRMHGSENETIGKLHRRSLLIEPRADEHRQSTRNSSISSPSDVHGPAAALAAASAETSAPPRPKTAAAVRGETNKFDFFGLGFKTAKHDVSIAE